MKQQVDKTIIIVARQAGTANAFLPVIRELGRAGCQVQCFAFTHAHKIFADSGVASILLDRFDEGLLSATPDPALLLTGTSECPDEDYLLWHWAKRAGIPSLAFVDSWIFYWQRFTPSALPENRFGYVPDHIAVIDRFMYDSMVQCGCDRDLLLITGNPAFDSLRNHLPKERTAVELEYGADFFLFLGEPFNPKVFGGLEKTSLGYTEAEVLKLTIEALELLGQPERPLVFRPHPRGGHAPEVLSLIERHSRIVLDAGEFASRDLVACAKVAFGMTSMLLFEASLMGVPALSIRPDRKLTSDIMDGCAEISGVFEPDLMKLCQMIKGLSSGARSFANAKESSLGKEILSILGLRPGIEVAAL